jgi:hypothetical protein
VVLHARDLPFVPSPSEKVCEVDLDDQRRQECEPDADPGDAPGQQEHREGLTVPGKLVDFFVSHRRQRDDGHVQGVLNHPPLDEHVSHRADDGQREEEQADSGKSSSKGPHGPVSGVGNRGSHPGKLGENRRFCYFAP